MPKTECFQIQALYEGVDEADRVVVADVFVQGLGEEKKLISI
ncbi:MAG: hypothetical protein WBB65_14515 [Anaerolineales bacterium]